MAKSGTAEKAELAFFEDASTACSFLNRLRDMPMSHGRGTMRFTSSAERQNLNFILQGAGGWGINISNHKSQHKSHENTEETQHHGQRLFYRLKPPNTTAIG